MQLTYRPPPTEFSAIVAGVRWRQPFTDHLLQSNLEARRYGLEVPRTEADARISEECRRAYWTIRHAARTRAAADAATASDGRVDRWG